MVKRTCRCAATQALAWLLLAAVPAAGAPPTVVHGAVEPHWLDSHRFWYRTELHGGATAYLMVDAAAGTRSPAFDERRMAAALQGVVHHPVAGDHLPIDSLSILDAGRYALVQSGVSGYRVDLRSYSIAPADEAVLRVAALAPDRAPRVSRTSAVETELRFVNRGAAAELWWVDTDGAHHSYGSLAAGAQRAQHTFAGHVWLATRSGVPVAAFVARPVRSVAEIPPQPVAGTERPEQPRGTSPDGAYRITFRDANAVLATLATGSERRLTSDGTTANAYGPEVWWAPDSRHFAVYRTVPEQSHPVYEVESSPTDQLQPRLHTLQYLKPGDQMATSVPHIFDAVTGSECRVDPAAFANVFELAQEGWSEDGREFRVLVTYRGFQHVAWIGIDAASGAMRPIIDERASTFIDWSNKVWLHVVPGRHEALWMSERDGWNHLYRYSTASGQVINQVTHGDWVVRAVDRVDDAAGRLWFRALGLVPGEDPYDVHYCTVRFDGTGFADLTPGNGTHAASITADHRWFVDVSSHLDSPWVSDLRQSEDGALVMHLEHGTIDPPIPADSRLPEPFVAKGRDGKTDIYGAIIYPSHFDPRQKYPVVENIYAGPQDAFAPHPFSSANRFQAVADLGFIVVSIDGMGTDWRSRAFHDVCYRNLADAGVPDRIAWIRAAARTRPYMDLTRVGIYGTSAGGQNALSAMLLHGDFYKVGVADCGCHDNRMDKLWWNEQWMGWPVGPAYAANSNVVLAPRLTGKLYLMVGELDNNVDPASTMQVVNALVHANKDFDLLVLPGAGHGVLGTAYGRRRMAEFLVQNLITSPPALSSPATGKGSG